MSKDNKTEEVHKGMPTLALVAPHSYNFVVSKEKHKITIPRKGTFKELDRDFFSKDTGDFEIANLEQGIINLSVITKVLFGVSKYPNMESNQIFCPISLTINKDTVDILGQVVTMQEEDITTQAN